MSKKNIRTHYHSRGGQQEVRQLLGLPVGEEPVVPVHALDVAVCHRGLILAPLTRLVANNLE